MKYPPISKEGANMQFLSKVLGMKILEFGIIALEWVTIPRVLIADKIRGTSQT